MRLSLLLFALELKLRWCARFSRVFRGKIRYVDRIVVVRSEDGRHARSFIFRHDRVSAQRGVHPDATVQLIWDDVRTAVSVMLSKNELDTFSAIGQGELTIEGNLQDALWFNDVAA